MAKELARSARALGRDMNFFGSKEKDFVIQTKGRVKINFGDKFIELFNGSKFTTGNGDIIKSTSGSPALTDPDGFYFDEDTGTLYLKIGDKIYEIFSNAKLKDGFISYTEDQSLSGSEQTLAKENIGSIFDTPEEARSSGGNGVVYIKSENKAYILQNGVLYPITNNTEINIGNESEGGNGYYFDKTVTIDIDDEGLALIIEGLKNYIRVGTEDNHTDIYQDDKGGVIDSDKSLTIKIDGKDQIVIKDGNINFESIINAIKGIITDEIYSSNFEENKSGWGLWIDKTSGESYLQVDHILSNIEIQPVYLRYQEAVELAAEGNISVGTTYVIIDYQNEWEITTVDNEYGTNIVKNLPWYPEENSLHPEMYEESDKEPKFGIDRNVRPLKLVGKSSYQFDDVVSYYYHEDNKDILNIRYDIRVQNYDPDKWPVDTETEEIYIDIPNKGRIYYMSDSWNNEAPCDFKHFKNDDGKWVFNSPEGNDLSSMNSSDSIVCSNNKILDVTIRLADKINPMIMTGKSINNNTLGGTFEEVTIGDPESIIEYNYFNGIIKKCNFVGTFVNNSIGCTMEECEFKKSVINNEFNKDIKKCIFNKEVTDNIFDMSFEDCNFGILSSNQFTGTALKCDFWNELLAESEKQPEIRENEFVGDFTECKFLGSAYDNDMKVDSVEKCTFEKDFVANQIVGGSWKENLFKDSLKNNIFQHDVYKLTCEGLTNINHFMGRVENVYFHKPENDPNYGVNNNVINGTIANVDCYVDFSHNIITGPIGDCIFNFGDLGDNNRCLFNYNVITVGSLNKLVTNHDFRNNVIYADYFNNCTTNGVFSYNSFKYYSMSPITATMKYCKGEGSIFDGTILADMENCTFCSFSNNTFKEEPIKYAVFRSGFGAVDFSSDGGVEGLKLLYDDKHQVDVFYHQGSVVVSCPLCNVSKTEAIKGEIKMFNGLIEDIPEGWHICDGTEGTPDLTDKFIKAGVVAGETGGSEGGEISITSDNIPEHTHNIKLTFDTSKLGTLNVVAADKIAEFVVDKGGSDNYCLYTGKKGGENYSISNVGSEIASALSNATATVVPSESTPEESETTPVKIEPPYYTLIFIMKL